MTMWQHWMVGQVDASIAAVGLLAAAVLSRRRLPPQVRSAILLIALVRLALPPWLRSPWSEALVDLPPIDDTRLLVTAWLTADAAVLPFAITVVVSLGLLARLVFQSRLMTLRLRSLDKAPPALQARVDRLAAGMPIDVRVSSTGEGPFATGVLRKVVVLPAALIDRLDDDALEAVLAHEVAHHARRDVLWLTMAAVLTSVAWLNPLTHLAARALVASREDGSDDWAVTHTSRDPFMYAQALLRSARMVSVPHPLAAGAHPMGGRLRRLLDGGAGREPRLTLPSLILVLLAAACCLPGAHMPALDASAEHP
jgi:beta-lactamase regulating signal transducer with metallopeptidase domain